MHSNIHADIKMDCGGIELQNLVNYYGPSSNIMENLHKLLLDTIERQNFQSFKQIVEENSKKQSAVIIVKYSDSNTEETYLDIASRKGLTKFVEFLLGKGAEINRVNEIHNCAPIHFAIEGGHINTLKILLAQRTINLDLEAEQRTALHIAVEKNDLNCARLLLERGASINILNSKNLTAFHLAAMKSQRDMVNMMLEYTQYLEVDKYRDYNSHTTREVIEQNLPELSLKLPSISENLEISTQDLKYYLNNSDEASFLKCIEIIQEEISSDVAENLLTISAQHNFRKAVTVILNRFEGKQFNVKRAARASIQHGYHVILGELLKIKPQIANDLILSACQELGMPRKREVDNTSDRLKCLELILEQNNVDVRRTDKKGNTPLHYAVRADNRKAISLLLNRGSYIGHLNKFNVPPIVDIPICTLSNYFDDCMKISKNEMNEYKSIEFDYRCLMPHNILTEQGTTRRATREMEVFLYIAYNESLKHLLKHPLLSSFLYLKWLKIRHILYGNFVFYGIFYFLLNAYIVGMTYDSPLSESGTQIVNDSFNMAFGSTLQIYCYQNNFLRIFVILLWLFFTFREILQYACCPYRYVTDWVNWLQIVLLSLIFTLFCGAGLRIGVVVIILSALELIILISQHPKMSVSFEMFRTVSLNYVYLLFPYIFLIIAFALAFYALFKDNTNFSGPGRSLFKTVIMITGEFNSNDIPFVSHPVWSHIVFVLFVFLIAIVLFNLLNGLAVSDTNKILCKSVLIGLISRIRLVVYLEDIAFGEPFSWFCCGNSRFLRWNPFTFLTNRILVFPHYLENGKINIKMYDNLDAYDDQYYVHTNMVNHDEQWPILKMDPDIIKQAKRIISDKNQLSDNEKIMTALNKQEEKINAMEIALRNLKPMT